MTGSTVTWFFYSQQSKTDRMIHGLLAPILSKAPQASAKMAGHAQYQAAVTKDINT